jgi:hypothetical protein
MKLVLDNDLIADEFFQDTVLLGIMAPMQAHQFVWQANHSIGFDFRINNDLEIKIYRNKRDYFFPVFEFQEPGFSLINYLYRNLYDGEYMLPEFKNLDYLWLRKGELPSREEDALLVEDIRNIQGVQLVTELTHDKIKNRDNLMF